MKMKETTIVALVALVGATILTAMTIIGPAEWMMVSGIAMGGKAAQGVVDRWPARAPREP